MPIYFCWFITALLSVSVVRTITIYRRVGAFLYCVRPCVLRHRVSLFTLCPLVSPEIAIGLEPPIEPWYRLASSPSADEPQGWQTSQSKTPRANRGAHLQQWAGSRDQNLLALRSRRNFFLDIPFYRTHRGSMRVAV